MPRLSAKLLVLLAAALGGCSTIRDFTAAPEATTVKVIAFNDFHGALEPPKQAVTAPAPDGKTVRVPAGGAAYLAAAINSLRAANPDNVVVAAGDLISASPLTSAAFLDEPSIEALSLMHLDFSAVGNHELDKGKGELLRMQNGGCETFTIRKPCALDPNFKGAEYAYLSANVLTEDGKTLFAPYAIRTYGKGRGRVKVAFIGLTLKGAPDVVAPSGIVGLRFTDEADAVNALIPELKKKGADAIVILIHQGGSTKVGYNDKSCAGLEGEIVPILDRLDPAVDLVVSGHTHRSYICDYGRINPAHRLLLTSGGNNGTLITDITLKIDPKAGRVVSREAGNVIVQSEAFTGPQGLVPLTDLYPRFPQDPPVAAVVTRAKDAVTVMQARTTGYLTAPATRQTTAAKESVLGDLIADAQWAAMRAPDKGGAQFALMNAGGLRADLVPAADGHITFGQLFAAQPFSNTLMVKTLTGRQVKAVLEQQFNSASHSAAQPYVLSTSAGLKFDYDLSKPVGERVVSIRLDGAPIQPDGRYRVVMNNFLASGGDEFTVLRDGTDQVLGTDDVSALEAWLTSVPRLTPPAPDRVRDLTPRR